MFLTAPGLDSMVVFSCVSVRGSLSLCDCGWGDTRALSLFEWGGAFDMMFWASQALAGLGVSVCGSTS